jgi:hypothetical protein
MEMRMAEGSGRSLIRDTGLITYSQGYETYGVMPDDVTSAVGETRWIYALERGDWKMRSETETRLTSDREDFIIEARMRAWEGDDLVHEETWDERIPRNLV